MTTLISPIASAKNNDLVFVSKTNNLVTDSRQVATYFGKHHRNVIAKLKSLECSDGFRSANFSAYHYKHEQNGELYQAYQMTKDGFMFLVMGFTGKRAAEIKERYINAFNEMAKQLSNIKLPSQPINHYPYFGGVSCLANTQQTTPSTQYPSVISCSKQSFWVTVDSDSMSAHSGAQYNYPSRTLILVDPSITPESGDFVVAINKDKNISTFRRYERDLGFQYLKPLKPNSL